MVMVPLSVTVKLFLPGPLSVSPLVFGRVSPDHVTLALPAGHVNRVAVHCGVNAGDNLRLTIVSSSTLWAASLASSV